jgi:hypothetical protein
MPIKSNKWYFNGFGGFFSKKCLRIKKPTIAITV